MTVFECYSFIVLTNLVILFNFRSSSGKEPRDERRAREGRDERQTRNRAGREPRDGAGRAVNKELQAGQEAGEGQWARTGRQARDGVRQAAGKELRGERRVRDCAAGRDERRTRSRGLGQDGRGGFFS